MTKKIVLKIFAVMAALCLILLMAVGLSQYYFFKYFYLSSKSKQLVSQLLNYDIAKDSSEAGAAYYKENGIWITTLDELGSSRHLESFSVLVQLSESQEQLAIPMYTMEGEFFSVNSALLTEGESVLIDAIDCDGRWLPYQVQLREASISFVNMTLAEKINGPNADPAYSKIKSDAFTGTIIQVNLPENTESVSFPFQEALFLEQIKEFQANLLLWEDMSLSDVLKYTISENGSEYEVAIKPLLEEGELVYVIAMQSLQPVDEAINVFARIYLYFLAFAFLLVLLVSFVFSRWLAAPLLAMNRVTRQMADRDFSQKLIVNSKDELGQLSGNINHLSDELENHITKLEGELDREKQLETTRKKFISGVSHELKTPLAVLKSCISILRDGIAEGKREHYFQAMEDEISHMDHLVVDMLELAKMESGTYHPETEVFELDGLLEQTCRMYMGQLEEKQLVLSCNLDTITVKAHEKLIGRVVSNFVSNALQHTDQGGWIRITAHKDGKNAMVSVENQGAPIAEEDILHVWEQFYRAGKNRKEGTGLGLAISKEILELHHAAYGVKNTAEGVCFYFGLPLKD